MAVHSILIVCMGNICRSPIAERMLSDALAGRAAVSSAGLQALVGKTADDIASGVAASHGISLAGHVARQYNASLGLRQDLILVMEPAFRAAVVAGEPALLGRTFLYDEWTGATGIPDPYRLSTAFHEAAFQQIAAATQAWAARLREG